MKWRSLISEADRMPGMRPKIRTNEDIPNFSAKGSRKRQLGSNGFLEVEQLRSLNCARASVKPG